MQDLNPMAWTQLFQDKPVSAQALSKMQLNIMSQIKAEPLDFAVERQLASRRRWGVVLGVCMLLTMLSLGIFFWIKGDVIFRLLTFEWSRMSGSISLLMEGVYYLWQKISLPIIGILCIFIVNRSSWNKRSV